MTLPPASPEALLVFGIIGVALAMFVTEVVPSDITAVGVIVALAVLEPWTGVSATEAIAGFASPATVTIVAMFMLSAGVQRTGVVQRLGAHMTRLTRGSETRALAATIGATGPIAGVVNNTPVVAVFIPLVTDLADSSGVSPSKLLLPLSYAAMLGGTLTLIGTSANILAGDLSRQLLGRPIGMFEFTKLGIVVLLVGAAYLMTVGRWLTPGRVEPDVDLTAEFELEDHLTEVSVREGSPIVGMSIDEVHDAVAEGADIDLDVLQLRRDEVTYHAPDTDHPIEPGDTLTVRASLQAVNRFAEAYGLRQRHRASVTEQELVAAAWEGRPVEVVVPPDSDFRGRSVGDVKFRERYDTTVLGVRRGEETIRTGLDDVVLAAGDTLLLQTTETAVEFLTETGDLVVTHRADVEPDGSELPPLDPKTPVALGVMAGVVVLAAIGVVPIVIAALGGVFVMVLTGTLTATEAYDAVGWNVVFLLAGVIPLGIAMQNTGGDALLASLAVGSAAVLPTVAVLALFYLLTGLLANLITPVASIVLMVPVAVDTAARIDASGFAFLLAAMFGASTAFMTPVGYQTNLMVYGPGGYTFGDYLRVGAPLQALLAVVTALGIAFFWGVSAPG